MPRSKLCWSRSLLMVNAFQLPDIGNRALAQGSSIGRGPAPAIPCFPQGRATGLRARRAPPPFAGRPGIRRSSLPAAGESERWRSGWRRTRPSRSIPRGSAPSHAFSTSPARPPPRASSFSASQGAPSSPTRPSPHASLSLTRDALATVVQEMEESCTSPPPSRDLAGGRPHARRRAAARADCRCPARVPWLPAPAAVAPRRSPAGRCCPARWPRLPACPAPAAACTAPVRCCRQAQDPQATPRRRRGTLPPRGRLRQLHDQVPCVRRADPTQAPPGSRHSTAGMRAHLPASDRFVDGTGALANGATIRCSPSGRRPLLPSCSARRPETLRKSGEKPLSGRRHARALQRVRVYSFC